MPNPNPNLPPDPANPQDNPVERTESAVPQDLAYAALNELSNPETVQAVKEFLDEKGLTIDEVTVTEGFWGWSQGAELATIKVGNEKYFVSPDDETTTALAIAMVENDIEDQPELFNQSFIKNYIDEESLRDALMSEVMASIQESPESYGLEPEPELEAQGEMFEPEVTEDQIESKAEEILRNPVEYLEEIYGEGDAVREAIRIAGIDTHQAAEDAVAADGEGHFLSTYDGNIHDLPSGGQYWRH